MVISGAAFNGPDCVMRVLDSNRQELGVQPIFGNNFYSVNRIDLSAIGNVFYLDEFDTSTVWRYRDLIRLDFAVIPVATKKISTCPVVITSPGKYSITKDLSCAGTAIMITASKVNLSLGGHTISGSGFGDGILVQRADDVSISGGTVQGFENGVEFQGTVDCKISNVTAKQNSVTGIAGRDSNIGLNITGNTTSQNGIIGIGIYFNGDFRGSTIERNTSNGNGSWGILLGGGFANTLTANTANENGNHGITLYANGNLVEHNTCDRNGNLGIGVAGDSRDNTVARNSATANGGQGIAFWDQPTHNTVRDNTVSGSYHGILLPNGPAQNTLQGNTATLNVLGIWVEQGSTGNTIQGNTALTNGDFDLGDQNFNCDSNAWTNNNFVTDTVAGAGDFGPGAGCIR